MAFTILILVLDLTSVPEYASQQDTKIIPCLWILLFCLSTVLLSFAVPGDCLQGPDKTAFPNSVI